MTTCSFKPPVSSFGAVSVPKPGSEAWVSAVSQALATRTSQLDPLPELLGDQIASLHVADTFVLLSGRQHCGIEDIFVFVTGGQFAGPFSEAPRYVLDGLKICLEQDLGNLLDIVLCHQPRGEHTALIEFLDWVSEKPRLHFLQSLIDVSLVRAMQIHGKEPCPLPLLDMLHVSHARSTSFYKELVAYIDIQARDHQATYKRIEEGWPSVCDPQVDARWALIPMPKTSHVYGVLYPDESQTYFVFPNVGIYIPETRVFLFLWKARETISPHWEGWFARLVSELIPVRQSYRRWLIEPDKHPALMPGAYLHHVGHVIWDEYQALDEILDLETSPGNLRLLACKDMSAVDLFGSVEEIYPEFSDRVVRCQTASGLLETCIREGLNPIPISGRHARYATRERLTAFAQRIGQEIGVDTIAGVADKPGALRVCFGLRLFNRTPDNLMELYLEIAHRLAERQPEVIIVFDGLNAVDDTAPKMAQANDKPRLEGDRKAPKKIELGSEQMAQESAFVDTFKKALRAQNIRVVNCVGMRLRDNLAWLASCDCFVAPYGAGLAKLRWALDVPGLALTGERNLKGLKLLKIYNDQAFMDTPFSRLEFSKLQDVGPAKGETTPPLPKAPVGIPFPDNFHVDVAATWVHFDDFLATLYKNRRPGLAS